ncbi:hypothetical protein [Pseudarthrobacter sp. PS3-L1]|uniref:hypothetical protein n=1 Tax=Pseudarthrobacter sp. PS3-L1 TaxID=3046207 RepID=UPI0024BB34FE|nr:hypothetical protein [Pseudarthrobacter sp. PS3-L1]MDJ0322109.1 hypothetical protein [Pseudarthrobacter sp. PS3-L1]
MFMELLAENGNDPTVGFRTVINVSAIRDMSFTTEPETGTSRVHINWIDGKGGIFLLCKFNEDGKVTERVSEAEFIKLFLALTRTPDTPRG